MQQPVINRNTRGRNSLVVTGIAVVILAWFAVWFVPQLTSGFITELADGNSGPQGPLESWRNDRWSDS